MGTERGVGMSAELNQLIRDVAESAADDAGPVEIAQAAIDKAGDELAGQFLLDLVSALVPTILGAQRRGAMGGNGGRSPKLERRRSWWARALQSRVAVGGGEWKRLGDCTVDDLRSCIADRESFISSVRGQIEGYEKLIAAMQEHAADTVGELTAEQVEL